ncbi:MAG TPA: TonB family protein [Pyrinomonadaceae bacterium]|nr:TonB family protein [Pyrinomonadaceae bacterium]
MATIARAAQAFDGERKQRVAVLDFGDTETGRRVADLFSALLSQEKHTAMIDRELSRAAARGVGYTGSLNMTLAGARDLGAAIGCDYFITGDAQTVRRSTSATPIYYEAYVSIFVVAARTGKLLMWERPSVEAATPGEAEKSLLAGLQRQAARARVAITRAEQDERTARERERATEIIPIEDAPEQGGTAAANYRAPLPYRRLRPAYPEMAARAEAEATIDVAVEIDAKGEVTRGEIVRWAGFGLDESVIETVRQLHFRPATRDGVPFPVRVLLRYNFRRPTTEASQQQ